MTKAGRLLTAMVVLVVAACSDGGSTGPDSHAAFSADAASYRPYAVASLVLNGQASAEGVVVNGMLGTTAVTLLSSSDSTMLLAIPETPGTHTLAFTIGTQSYSGAITVSAAESVADPVAFLDAAGDMLEEQLNAVSAVAAAAGPLTGDSAVAVQMLEEGRDSLASFRAQLAQLTPDQQQQVADIINANLMDEDRALVVGIASGSLQAGAYRIPARCVEGKTALEQYMCTWGAFTTSIAKVTGYLSGAYIVAHVPVVGWVASAFLSGFATVEGMNMVWLGRELLVIHAMLVAESIEAGGGAVVDATTNLFRTVVLGEEPEQSVLSPGAGPSAFAAASTSSLQADMTRFSTDRPVTFSFSPKVRPVQLTDRALPLSWLQKPLRLVTEFNRLIAHYDPAYQLKFAAPAATFPWTVPSDEIDVEVVTNDKVKVKSVTGTGDRTTVTFTTTAAGVQRFTYDIIYTSGVYPDVRVRHQAELHPPTFMLTDLNGVELPDTMRIMGRWQYSYLLLNPDGSRIDPNLHVDMGTVTTYQGAHVGMTYGFNSVFYVNANQDMGRQRMVDTVNLTVYKDAAPLREMTWIVTDSASMYWRSVPGTYVYTHWESQQYRDRLVFNDNGTGTIVSRVAVASGQPVTVSNPDFTWEVWQRNDNGKPVFDLEWGWASYGYRMPLTYGATTQTSPAGETLVRQ